MVYFLILVAFFVLYFLIPHKQAWIPFLLLVFALATLAFYCEPNDTDDLFRYFRIIDQMRVGGWDRFQEMIQIMNLIWSTTDSWLLFLFNQPSS